MDLKREKIIEHERMDQHEQDAELLFDTFNAIFQEISYTMSFLYPQARDIQVVEKLEAQLRQ